MNSHNANVLIVASLPLICQGIKSIISDLSWIRICGSAKEAPHARRLCQECQPDLIVLDMELEKGGGLDLLRGFSQLRPGVRTIALSGSEEASWIQRIFRNGAAGFISKHDRVEELSHAIFWVLTQQERYLIKSAKYRLLEQLLDNNPIRDLMITESLSNRELEIFRLLAAGKGAGAIATSLGVSRKTIESHYSRIKDKLGIHSARELKRRAEVWLATKP